MPHKAATAGVPLAVIGNVIAWVSVVLEMKKQTLPNPHNTPLI